MSEVGSPRGTERRTAPAASGLGRWDRGREPGGQLVSLGLAVALSAVVVDLALGGELSLFFDLCFVLLCVGLAMLVRVPDVFTVGVLPPLIMLSTFLLLALASPGAIGHPEDGVVQAVVSGLSAHATALVVGYALCLGCLAARQRARNAGR